jgi:hypothetical protein
MARFLALASVLTLVMVACSNDPTVLRPNDATRFRVEVTYRPLQARARECRNEPFPGSRPCRIRFSATITNVGNEDADAICFVTFHSREGERHAGSDKILGTVEAGRSDVWSGGASMRAPLGGLDRARCASYDVGSTGNFG